MKTLFATAAVAAAFAAAAPALAGGQQHGYRFITDTLAPGGGKTPTVRVVDAQTQGYRFITDTLAPGGGNHGTAAYLARSSTRFSWGAAGIGASAAAGLLCLVAGSGLLVVRRARLAT